MKELDRDVNSLGGEIRIQNAEIRTGDTLKEASDVIHEATSLHGPIESTQQESQMLRSQILGSSQSSAGYSASLLPLQIITGTLAGMLVILLLLAPVFPRTVTSALSVIVLAGGFGTAIYFVVKKQ